MIFVECGDTFGEAYPGKTARLRHSLCGHPLFEIDRILELMRSVPERSIEHNSAAIGAGHDPAKMPSNGLTPEETVRRIGEVTSWLVVMNVEQDPEYAALMERALKEFAPHILRKTGPMNLAQGYVFVSSPHAVTPFHMDPEHNILLQIRGGKTMYVYEDDNLSMVSQETHERFHETRLRNIGYRPEYETFGERYALNPGDALFVPLKSPHRVDVGGEVSISFSITWRSRLSDDDAHLHLANAMLRRLGASPAPPGAAPIRDRAKVLAHKLYSKLHQ